MKLKMKNNYQKFTLVPGMEFKFTKGMKRGSFRILRIGNFPLFHNDACGGKVIIGGHFPYPYLSELLSYGEFGMTVEEFHTSVSHMDSLILTKVSGKKGQEKATNKGTVIAINI